MANNNLKAKQQAFKEFSTKEKTKKITDLLLNNAMYIIIILAVIYVSIKVPAFLKLPSIVNVISLTGGKIADSTWDRRLYCTYGYRYFRGACSGLDSMYLSIPAYNNI